MYTRRAQIVNYGPIDKLDIAFPFEGDIPKPVLLVGENGSGKSILLSHIVNGLILAKGVAYPETPEVEKGKVFKLRTSLYIKMGSECYFGKINFEGELSNCEVRSRLLKQEYKSLPQELSGEDAKDAWDQMQSDKNDHFFSSISSGDEDKIEKLYASNCVLYFPSNRFEEPAWLNEENLKAHAEYMDLTHLQGYTNRRILNYSPLHDNQNWLFDVVYDRAVFETRTINPLPLSVDDRNPPVHLPAFLGHSGKATSIYKIALQVVQRIMGESQNVRFGIGHRLHRVVSLEGDKGQIVPNIFQLSSGETSVLNLFLSILRDFDLCGAPVDKAEDIRGIAIVDEIDLHLHADHQYSILPDLIRMFPKVQFVVTTHSPLFVLGMSNVFGENGFGLYRLPSGHQISPEEFSEFESAYRSFAETSRFADDIRKSVKDVQKPVVYLDGKTDVRYLQKAAELLNQKPVLDGVQLRGAKGSGNLGKIWNNIARLPAEVIRQKVVLFYDCDDKKPKNNDEGNLFGRIIPKQTDHPIKTGIENLFSKATLEKAQAYNDAFIDVDSERTQKIRGESETIPEKWTINKDEKTNVCKWLCENGTAEDFKHFRVIFDRLQEILDVAPPVSADHSTQEG